jgi:hypothetical protein
MDEVLRVGPVKTPPLAELRCLALQVPLLPAKHTSGAKRWSGVFASVALIACCEREPRLDVDVPPGFRGPAVVVADTPGSGPALAGVKLPASGIGFVSDRLPARRRMFLLDGSGAKQELGVVKSRTLELPTECGCYRRWLVYVDAPAPADKFEHPVDKRATSEWFARRRAAGVCKPEEC